ARVELRLLDGDPSVVRDRFTGPQRAHDLDRLEQPRVALALRRPGNPADVLVQRLAAADGQPEALRKHFGKRRGGLREHGRVITPARRADTAEVEVRRAERSAEPRPREAALPLHRCPRMEVVRAHGGVEARLLRAPHVFEERARGVLLVRGVIAVTRHIPPYSSRAGVAEEAGRLRTARHVCITNFARRSAIRQPSIVSLKRSSSSPINVRNSHFAPKYLSEFKESAE